MAETTRLSQMLVHTATMLVANDLDRSVAFYRDQFGFAIQYQEESVALLEMGPMLLYLVTESPPTLDKPPWQTPTPRRAPVSIWYFASRIVGQCTRICGSAALRF